MLKRTLQIIGLAIVTSTNAMAGETPKTVVELFTSQGCSSCPPANRFAGKLAEDPENLVLSYAVTYWDFLGWKDVFGKQEFTTRQKKYGESLGIGYVYTPQIVLNGTDHNSKYKKSVVEDWVLAPSAQRLDLRVVNDELVLETDAQDVLLVSYKPGWQKIDVKRGENGGRKMKIANVVEDIRKLTSSGPTSVQREAGMAYAALIHDPENFQIIAASVVRPEISP